MKVEYLQLISGIESVAGDSPIGKVDVETIQFDSVYITVNVEKAATCDTNRAIDSTFNAQKTIVVLMFRRIQQVLQLIA